MEPTTVFLNESTQRDLQELAKQQGKTTDEIVQEAIQLYIITTQKQLKSIGTDDSSLTDLSACVDVNVSNIKSPSQPVDRRAFIKLPIEERRRILAEQAEAMVEHYEQDSAWREWVNFDIGEYNQSQTR